MEFLALVLIFMSSAFIFIHFHTEPWVLVTVFVKILLLLACLTFIIQFIGKRLRKFISKYRSSVHPTAQEKKENDRDYKEYTQKIQEEFQSKVENYKEKILIPREEAKRRQKEEEYYRFLGPAWKGKGEALGGEARNPDDEVRLNRLEENVNEELLEQVKEEQAREAKRRQRKRIILPEEPSEDNPNSLQVILRSPLGQIHTRRFLYEDSLQVILDFITTLGFNQRRYTLATSYPRQLLSDKRELTLTELEFTKRTTLNIEELE